MDRHDPPSRSAGLTWPGADRIAETNTHATAAPAAAPTTCDATLVSRAAALASLSEFDLFRAAWQQWHGSAADERRMEQVFARYLQEQTAPGWVRHFARRIVAEARDGRLDRAGLALDGYRRCEPLPDLTCRFTTEALCCCLLALIVILF